MCRAVDRPDAARRRGRPAPSRSPPGRRRSGSCARYGRAKPPARRSRSPRRHAAPPARCTTSPGRTPPPVVCVMPRSAPPRMATGGRVLSSRPATVAPMAASGSQHARHGPAPDAGVAGEHAEEVARGDQPRQQTDERARVGHVDDVLRLAQAFPARAVDDQVGRLLRRPAPPGLGPPRRSPGCPPSAGSRSLSPGRRSPPRAAPLGARPTCRPGPGGPRRPRRRRAAKHGLRLRRSRSVTHSPPSPMKPTLDG